MKGYSDRGREAELRRLLKERILILDGGTGTALQAEGLSSADFGSPDFEGCNEYLVLSRPELISKVHAAYLAAGADIIETDTFGATRHVLAEYGLQERAADINAAAVRLALAEARRCSAPQKPRFVAGSMGPGTKSILVTGGISFEEVRSLHAEQARALTQAGCDLLLLETQQDTLNIKASLLGIEDAFSSLGRRIPVMLSVSVEPMGAMLGGQDVAALCAAVEHFDLLAVGLNCAMGPDLMTGHLRTLSSSTRAQALCYPNAGLPDENGRYGESPEAFAAKVRRFAQEGLLNIAGGCCGTTPAHIRATAQALAGMTPRTPPAQGRSSLSGMEALIVGEDRRPVLVGERANVIGSKIFRDLISREAFEEAAETARRQVRSGAQIVDVCLANPDRDEKSDMERFLRLLVRRVKVPWMIDSTDPSTIEAALRLCPGKAVINSVNLEDGEARMMRTAELARRYGAALVVGTIDEDKGAGMALTRARKLDVARRERALLRDRCGMQEEDLYFDPLVFPCASGDRQYIGSARETIEGLRLIRQEFPLCRTVLGVSNVSFGLPPAGREVLNAVFLQHCVQAGLDLAIVNAEKLARFSALSEEERLLSERLLFWDGSGTADPAGEFSALFRERKSRASTLSERMPPEERVVRCVLEGSKEGLDEALRELLKTLSPLAIVNGPLMKGMDAVGRLFGENKLIVTEVLQSAQVMNAAVSLLEPHMEGGSRASRGKILLATVRGDVHDIGKNLVQVILRNNGYEVVDLGIKVESQTLVQKVRELKPDLLGLSGLLVKSTHQMEAAVSDLRAAGISVPVLVGGAALTARFTASRIASSYDGPVLYARDALAGLQLANGLHDPARRPALLEENARSQEALRSKDAAPDPENSSPASRPPQKGGHPIPTPPDLRPHVLASFDLDEIFKYIDETALYGRHLGLRGRLKDLLDHGDPRAEQLHQKVRALMSEAAEGGLIRPKAALRFFSAASDGDSVHVYDAAQEPRRPLETFVFPRQKQGERLCVADFIEPSSSGRIDYLAMFVVNCGEGIPEASSALDAKGEYLKAHALRSLSLACAEAFAELLHERIRSMWGIPDAAGLSLQDKLHARYRGARISFGYPSCPAIEDQAKLLRLIDAQAGAGVRLTEGSMMEPEASVSAIVLHHPQAGKLRTA
ncbi:MAG: methionine synthase [Elusimicrobiota bacterium]|jgi:5-methyltetrahydrofolate--homocysteine methyltransferase